MRHIERYRPYG
jgi:hypothetical protein